MSSSYSRSNPPVSWASLISLLKEVHSITRFFFHDKFTVVHDWCLSILNKRPLHHEKKNEVIFFCPDIDQLWNTVCSPDLVCLTHSSSPPKICFFQVLPEKDHLKTHSCAVRTSVDILWRGHSLHLASNQSSPGRLTY